MGSPGAGRWLRYGLPAVILLAAAPAVGVLGGAAGYTDFTCAAYRRMDPAAYYDGQSAMAFLFTLPLGALIGVAYAYWASVSAVAGHRWRGAVGLVLSLAATLATLAYSLSFGGGIPEDTSLGELLSGLCTLPGEGAPLLWTGALGVVSLVMVLPRPRKQRRAQPQRGVSSPTDRVVA